MYTRTNAGTTGFLLLNVGLILLLDRYFEIFIQDTWPLILIAMGVYIFLVPKRKSAVKPIINRERFRKTALPMTKVQSNSEQIPLLTRWSLITIFSSLLGLFVITALITHIWTVVIAFTEGGFFGGVISLLLPFLAELYWMFKMFGENDTYSYCALTHLILAIPFSMFGRK